MASTTNNSGLTSNTTDEFGPDEQYDDETEHEFSVRMKNKKEFKERQRIAMEDARSRMTPPCIG
jgi:hypothetical protein